MKSPTQPSILVVDDDSSNRVTLERIFTREGYTVHHAANGRDAIEQLRAELIDLVVTDLKMPGMSGIDLLKAARTLHPDMEVVVMTAYGTVETAVEAMKEGAYDFVAKPLKRIELVTTVRKALEKRSLRLENRQLRAQLSQLKEREFIGNSDNIRNLMDEVEQIAPSDATVFLTGASGTGKGRLAHLLHDMSRRAIKPFITVNCSSLPEALLESELFGHEKGAFTGATQKKEGRFDLARGGTLFLDEITEMKPSIQVKLLRVLQEGEYERVGGTKTLLADVRVIAASNRNVEDEVASGSFRQDLFYRLNVIRLDLPTLAERSDDIPFLAQYFLRRFTRKNQKTIDGFTDEAMDALLSWSWPGNVRELENAVERAVVLCRAAAIGVEHLPQTMQKNRTGKQRITFDVGTPLKLVEKRMIEETLRYCNDDKTLAASLMGITARTIYRREAEWGDKNELED